GRLAQLDPAAKQTGKLPADRQPQAGPAVFPAGARVCLLKRLKDNPLLLGGDADASVGDLKRHDGCGASQNRMVTAPTTGGHRHGKLYTAVFGELERVGQQVLEHLLQTLRVGDQAAREMRI